MPGCSPCQSSTGACVSMSLSVLPGTVRGSCTGTWAGTDRVTSRGGTQPEARSVARDLAKYIVRSGQGVVAEAELGYVILADADLVLFECIGGFYYSRRIQRLLGFLSPMEFEPGAGYPAGRRPN